MKNDMDNHRSLLLSPVDPPAPPGGGGADGEVSPPPSDELHGLLRDWHETNRARAAAGRERLLATLKAGGATETPGTPEPSRIHGPHARRGAVRRLILNRYSPLAVLLLLGVMVPFFLSRTVPSVSAEMAANIVMAPEGGRLDALDDAGNVLGPCALAHTDVNIAVSGSMSRVTLRQKYRNPYPDKIEAVYTFPMSADAAVDRMSMAIGDRVIVGEVREREAARAVYEAAREHGRVASLLEQERPNIFTQSVANIEPGATVDIEISYVESITPRDGEYTLAFPTVVSPRFIPGGPTGSMARTVAEAAAGASEFTPRHGVVLLAPATIEDLRGVAKGAEELGSSHLAAALSTAHAIQSPENAGDQSLITRAFTARYPDGSAEPGVLRADGAGHVGGRWFRVEGRMNRFRMDGGAPDRAPGVAESGGAFAADSHEVPDASRITPMPVRPPMRAGHDLSITVTIDTGGPGIRALETPLHRVLRTDTAFRKDADRGTDGLPRSTRLALANEREIPNRDFVLSWRLTDDAIADQCFTHTGEHGNFFSISLQPPARVEDAQAVPRELVFVLDTSGSMNGLPMETSKTVMRALLEGARERDVFNVITFAGATSILWNEPRAATAANIAEASTWIGALQGQGGTQMMTAINAALSPTKRSGVVAAARAPVLPADLLAQPADGRSVTVKVHDSLLVADRMEKDGTSRSPRIELQDGRSIQLSDVKLPEPYLRAAVSGLRDHNPGNFNLLLTGTWTVRDGRGFLDVKSADLHRFGPLTPDELVVMPADGREVELIFADSDFRRVAPADAGAITDLDFARIKALEGAAEFAIGPFAMPGLQPGEKRIVRGVWELSGGKHLLRVTHGGGPASAGLEVVETVAPLRLVIFLTDGLVGNDLAIVDEIKRNRATTRVFAFGIGNSVNRFLIDSMAREGGGEAEFVVINEGATEADARAAAERFTLRTATPVLADVRVEFSGNLSVLDVLPDVRSGLLPDLFSVRPLTILGRYTGPGTGTVTISGRTGSGAWNRTIPITLPEREPANDVIATLWARQKINWYMGQSLAAVQRGTPAPEIRDAIVRIGETFSIMSQYTSFVAVDRLRVTVAGRPRLVPIPIELPHATNWEGFFGRSLAPRPGEEAAPDLLGDIPLVDLDAALNRGGGGSSPFDALEAVAGESNVGFDPGLRLRRNQQAVPLHAPNVAGQRWSAAGSGAPAEPGGPRGRPVPQSAANGGVRLIEASPALSLSEPAQLAASPAPSPPAGSARERREDAAGASASRAAPAERPAASPKRDTQQDPGRASEGDIAATKSTGPGSTGAAQSQPGQDAESSAVDDKAPIPPAEVQERNARWFVASVTDLTIRTPDGEMPLPEQMVSQSAAFYSCQALEQGQMVAAQTATQLGLQLAPSDPQLQKVAEVIAQPEQSPEVTRKQAAHLGRQVRQDFDREAALLTRLDRRLYLMIRPPSPSQALLDAQRQSMTNTVDPRSKAIGQAQRSAFGADARVRRPVAETKSGVIVSVLVTDTSGATVDALKAAGLSVRFVSEAANVVVGEVPVDKLEGLTLLPQVRRIEGVEE